MDGSLRFGGQSLTWGGGVAFLDDHAEAEVHSTVYLITEEQFFDLLSQECRAQDIEFRLPAPGQSVRVADCWYGRVLHAGMIDRLPVYTFTDAEPQVENRPVEAYLDVMADGLRTVHELAPDHIAQYLASARPSLARPSVPSHRGS